MTNPCSFDLRGRTALDLRQGIYHISAMVPVDKLQLIQQRFQYLEAKMNDGVSGDEIAKLGREYSDLKPVIDLSLIHI